MGNFGRALLGGIAGAAGSAEEVFDSRITSKETQRKEAVITKRREMLTKLRNDYAVDRDTARYENQDRVRAENNMTTNLARPSGQVIAGIPQTRGDMQKLPNFVEGASTPSLKVLLHHL